MKGTKFTTQQMMSAVQRVESGQNVREVARELGVHFDTIYNWKKKFSGMTLSEAKRLKELEEENRRLKRLVADQALDILGYKEIVSKKW